VHSLDGRALAEQVSMQVLQRVDLFTDTGLKSQLAQHLRPIVERASAELVNAITEHVGGVLRSYVAEAIERAAGADADDVDVPARDGRASLAFRVRTEQAAGAFAEQARALRTDRCSGDTMLAGASILLLPKFEPDAVFQALLQASVMMGVPPLRSTLTV